MNLHSKTLPMHNAHRGLRVIMVELGCTQTWIIFNQVSEVFMYPSFSMLVQRLSLVCRFTCLRTCLRRCFWPRWGAQLII